MDTIYKMASTDPSKMKLEKQKIPPYTYLELNRSPDVREAERMGEI